MTKKLSGLALAFSLACSFSASASANDRCVDATVVTAGETVRGTTDGSLNDGVSSCGSFDDSPDRWFRYDSTADEILTVTTCGTEAFDTGLVVYSQCGGRLVDELACNDDSCGLASTIRLGLEPDRSYLIRVTGYGGESGPFVLNVSTAAAGETPANDDCENAIEAELDAEYSGDTTTATNDGTSTCAASANASDVWYVHTAEEAGLLVGSLCGSSYDTALSAHSDCSGSAESQLRCNDDACGVQSTVAVPVEQGETVFFRVSGFSGEVGAYTFSITSREIPKGEGADMVITNLTRLEQVGRLGDTVALSCESTICNEGSVAVDWLANPDPHHPFLIFNAYRLHENRLEQIGQSWVKHGFAASQSDGICSGICIPDEFGGLGVGCADIYGVGTNAAQDTYGPRYEINGWTGGFTYAGSHIDTTSSQHNPIQHRLQIHEDDMSRGRYPGALYFLELYVLSHDDVDHTNSVGYKRFAPSGSPGGTWNFALVEPLAVQGLIFDAWPESERTQIPAGDKVPEGRAYLATHVTENEDGTWHYEYSLFNLDFERNVRSFTIDIPSSTQISGVEFHAPRDHDVSFSNDAWTHSRTGTGLTFTTTEGDDANPLRWGTMYTFRFDANAEPVETTATIGLVPPGETNEYSGLTRGPAAGGITFKRGDSTGDGAINVTDAVATLAFLFRGEEAPTCFDAADSDDNGTLELTDPVHTLNWLFLGGSGPPDPGTQSCGIDPTEDDLTDCEYSCEA
ncbi:MAG: hypothetical protein AAF517_04945 [Planctomycetota bacterium]